MWRNAHSKAQGIIGPPKKSAGGAPAERLHRATNDGAVRYGPETEIDIKEAASVGGLCSINAGRLDNCIYARK
jgi:hypothetical protein